LQVAIGQAAIMQESVIGQLDVKLIPVEPIQEEAITTTLEDDAIDM
jgi:hypothetical protein